MLEGLVGWLFILVLLTSLTSGGSRSEEPASPTVVVNAAPPAPRTNSGVGTVIGFLAALWLIAYALSHAA